MLAPRAVNSGALPSTGVQLQPCQLGLGRQPSGPASNIKPRLPSDKGLPKTYTYIVFFLARSEDSGLSFRHLRTILVELLGFSLESCHCHLLEPSNHYWASFTSTRRFPDFQVPSLADSEHHLQIEQIVYSKTFPLFFITPPISTLSTQRTHRSFPVRVSS